MLFINNTSLVLALALAKAVAAVTAVDKRDATTCRAVHIFLARGFNEGYPGRQGVLVDAICSELISCDYEDIIWTTSMDYGFCDAVAEGTASGLAQITAYNQECPNSTLVLSGYSQGAHVVGDVLGGGNGTFFDGCVQKSNAGLDPSTAPGNKIAAALAFGDDRHTANQTYNVESASAIQGLFPRSEAELENLSDYAALLRSYCVLGDPICAGGDVNEAHWAYFDNFTDDAAAWVKQRLDQNTTSPASSTSQTSVATSSTEQATSTSTSTSTASSISFTSAATSATSTGTSGASTLVCSISITSLAIVATLATFFL